MNRQFLFTGSALAAAAIAALAATPAPTSAYGTGLTFDQPGTVALPAGAQVGGGTISVGSATVASGGQVTVDLRVTPDAGAAVGVVDLQVKYDNAVVTATACTVPKFNGVCNPTVDPNTVGFSLVTLSGLTGVEGTLTFQAIGSDGMSSALDVMILTCGDAEGNPITCADADGVITVTAAAPTPSPTPSPTPTPPPTPSPTPSPAPLPTTLPSPTIPPTIPFPFVFAPKFLCGTAGPGDPSVKPGSYATAINLHNSSNRAVQLGKQAVLAFGEDEPRGLRSAFRNLSLASDDALRIDCPDIRALLGLPADDAFIEGFVVVGVLPTPGGDFFPQMDVFAVYTSQFVTSEVRCLQGNGTVSPPTADGKCPKGTTGIGVGTGAGTDTDVERIDPTFTGFFPPPVSPPQSPPQSPPIGAALDAVTSTPGLIGGSVLTGATLAGMGLGFLRILRANGRRDDLDL